MNEAVSSLHAWETFYVIVGSSAGALTGLQFVVLTLIAETGTARRSEPIAAFGTPTVVHFCAALLTSALLSVPWPGLGSAGVAVAWSGALGLTYAAIVLRRALRQRSYRPVLEDWVWHTILPALAYATLLIAGAALTAWAVSPFAIAAAVLLLVFIGIHNAWDTIMYITLERARLESEARE